MIRALPPDPQLPLRSSLLLHLSFVWWPPSSYLVGFQHSPLWLRDLAGDGPRGFFLATFENSQRAVNIVKAYYAGLKAVVPLVITAELLCKQFFPTVSRLGFRRIGVFFAQWSYVRARLLALTIHAR